MAPLAKSESAVSVPTRETSKTLERNLDPRFEEAGGKLEDLDKDCSRRQDSKKPEANLRHLTTTAAGAWTQRNRRQT